MNKNQNGFITMIVIMLAIAGLVVWFAINRIVDAQNADSNEVGIVSSLQEI